MSTDRDLQAELSILNTQVAKDPDNLLLRKRRDMAARAITNPAFRQDYFDAYPPPHGASPHAMRARRANFKRKRRPDPHKVPTDEEFVRAWQASSSKNEVAERLGIVEHVGWVGQYGGILRRSGVKLQELDRLRLAREKRDVDALNDLIESMGEPEAAAG